MHQNFQTNGGKMSEILESSKLAGCVRAFIIAHLGKEVLPSITLQVQRVRVERKKSSYEFHVDLGDEKDNKDVMKALRDAEVSDAVESTKLDDGKAVFRINKTELFKSKSKLIQFVINKIITDLREIAEQTDNALNKRALLISVGNAINDYSKGFLLPDAQITILREEIRDMLRSTGHADVARKITCGPQRFTG